jgi:putative chitinase
MVVMTLDLERLWLIAPRAQADYKLAFRLWRQAFARFDVSTPLRAQHLLGQVLHESGGLRFMVEDLTYRSSDQLRRTWPSRFPTHESTLRYLGAPKLLAAKVYDHRSDLGNTVPGDGWTYRGRGLIQVTGRANYIDIGLELGLDLVTTPDLVIAPAYALFVACCIWKRRGCNRYADDDDLQGVTRRVNGGLNGLPDRRAWLNLARTVVQDAEVKA